MKIAVVSAFDYFGHFGNWIANGLEMNGHEVVKIDRKYIHLPEHTDMIFMMDCSEDFSQGMKGWGIPTVYWCHDTHMPGGLERSLNIAKYADVVFHMNYEVGVKTLQKFGVESYWMPSGADEKLLSNPTGRCNYDVAMIGNPNSTQRVELWNMLNSEFNSFAGRMMDKHGYIDIMSNCKIVVSQPTEPHNSIINTRPLEGMAYGKLVLAKKPDCSEWDKLGAKDGEHIVFWKDFDDLRDKLKYYLSHEEERLQIAKNGKPIGERHTIQRQLQKMEQIWLTKFYNRLNG